MVSVEVTKKVVMYGTRYCPWCLRAKALLKSKGVTFEEILVDEHPDRRKEMIEKSNRYTVPQIWLGDEHIGGCDDLYALERQGGLDERLGS